MVDLLPDQRRRKILEKLRADGVVRVAALAAELSVTEETVRRDLKHLDRQGVLIRTHGGASLIDRPDPASTLPLHGDAPFEERLRARSVEKRAIAREAATRIRAGQVIALDGSTTAWELACLLDLPRLTVVTNSLVITNLLASRGNVQVICVGGTLDVRLQMFGGILAEAALTRLHIDLAFFSCAGIDPERGLSDPTDSAGHIKRRLIEIADRSVLLADSSKLNRRAVVFFADPGDVDELITDAAAPAEVLERIRSLGVQCTTVAT
ncbi:MAG: DeoR/GlpR family DNA-binding transcription regulator [Phycisphaerae bacterium]|nr:DeoR/GlpR family DNA-binding transcription regulator [Phycisphaerae bacterium]MDW8262073.1 DeoR/GlpR family DNA-binding transcription regulator [Phycisphaerales bacterium]